VLSIHRKKSNGFDSRRPKNLISLNIHKELGFLTKVCLWIIKKLYEVCSAWNVWELQAQGQHNWYLPGLRKKKTKNTSKIQKKMALRKRLILIRKKIDIFFRKKMTFFYEIVEFVYRNYEVVKYFIEFL